MTAELNVEGVASAKTTAKKIGFQFWDAEKVRVFQARLDGFTYSRLAPYDCWEDLCGEARRLWRQYREFAKPERVSRIAVRYINRLDRERSYQTASCQSSPAISGATRTLPGALFAGFRTFLHARGPSSRTSKVLGGQGFRRPFNFPAVRRFDLAGPAES